MIVWLTGQPGSGKSTLAVGLYMEYRGRREKVMMVDGDDLREIMPNPGYNEAGRIVNIDRAQAIAAYLDRHVDRVLVSLVAPYREQREKFKEEQNVIEVYVHTNEVRGREEYHVREYEPPLRGFIDCDTTGEDPAATVRRLYREVAAAS